MDTSFTYLGWYIKYRSRREYGFRWRATKSGRVSVYAATEADIIQYVELLER